MKIESFTREQVVKIIDELLQRPDMLTDAVSNENTNHDAESLLEKVEEEVMREYITQQVEKNYKLENIKETVLEEYKKGNIVIYGIDGLQAMPLKEFIKQPADGMLYDLNRNEMVVLTFINDPKWVNDYAVCKVIKELKSQLSKTNLDKKKG